LAIDGFGVVAQEAKRLADEAKETAARIAVLLDGVNESMANLDGLSSVAMEAVLQSVAVTVENDEAINSGDTGEIPYDTTQAEKLLADMAASIKIKLADMEKGLMMMRNNFRGILNPLSEIIKVAKQTNLLGVRASIEAAHSTNDKKDFDMLLNKHMTVQARIAANILEVHPTMTCEEITEMALFAGVDEFWIANGQAEVEITNIDGGKGFVYKNEGQTAPYLRLLENPELVITMPPEMRVLDNRVFKYVGVSRKDKTGFVQVGRASKIYGESTAEGFAVVARQIKNLAEQSRDIASEVVEMIEDMDGKAKKSDEMITGSKKILADATAIIGKFERISTM
jgi:methyl-accepting chemotaxis protein